VVDVYEGSAMADQWWSMSQTCPWPARMVAFGQENVRFLDKCQAIFKNDPVKSGSIARPGFWTL